MMDATCPALHAALQAAEKGVPFMPLRGLIGSDVLKYRADWKVIDSPFGNSDPIVLLPAIKPDVALLHAPMADRSAMSGSDASANWPPWRMRRRRRSSTVEKIHDGNLLDDPVLAAGTLPGLLCGKRRGGRARRLAAAAAGSLRRRRRASRGIRSMAATAEGFAEYLDRYVYAKRAA